MSTCFQGVLTRQEDARVEENTLKISAVRYFYFARFVQSTVGHYVKNVAGENGILFNQAMRTTRGRVMRDCILQSRKCLGVIHRASY